MDRNKGWYYPGKGVLKSMQESSQEVYETADDLLCKEYHQRADDCIAIQINRGASEKNAKKMCAGVFSQSMACKTKILCPSEFKAFVAECSTRKAAGLNNIDCLKALQLMEKCANKYNLIQWWLDPVIRPEGLPTVDMDRYALRAYKSGIDLEKSSEDIPEKM